VAPFLSALRLITARSTAVSRWKHSPITIMSNVRLHTRVILTCVHAILTFRTSLALRRTSCMTHAIVDSVVSCACESNWGSIDHDWLQAMTFKILRSPRRHNEGVYFQNIEITPRRHNEGVYFQNIEITPRRHNEGVFRCFSPWSQRPQMFSRHVLTTYVTYEYALSHPKQLFFPPFHF